MKKSVEKEEPLYQKIISYVVSILCLLLCLYITIEVINANTNNRPPRIFGLSVSYVPTASMEPTINTGDYIMFKKANTDKLYVGSGTIEENHLNRDGDIAIYYNEKEDKFIVHRVVYKGIDDEGEYFIFFGDNNSVEDTDKVRSNMIYGKYITTLGFMAIFSGGINQNLIFFILIVIFVIMLIMQLASIFIKGKTDDLKKQQEDKKQQMLEELKREIMAEELAKLRAENAKLLEQQEETKDEKSEE